MLSRRQKAFNFYVRYFQKTSIALIPTQPLARLAFNFNAWLLHKRQSTLVTRRETLKVGQASVPVMWAHLEGQDDNGMLLYIHGGAFVIGSVQGYSHLAAEIGAQSGLKACLVDYGLAPENPFPAAPNDVLRAYKGLLGQGYRAENIVVCGDSAGGALTLALLHMLVAEGIDLPKAAAVLSPVTDLAFNSPSMEENRKSDMLVSERWGKRGIRDYLAGQDTRDPRASPIYGSFEGCGPVLVQYVEEEVLRDDSVRMVQVLEKQGVEVVAKPWSGVPHVWHLTVGRIPEADKAVREIAAFFRAHLR